MRTRGLLIKAVILSVLLVFLTSTGVVASQTKRIITATGEEIILNYSEEIYWSEEQFNQEYENYK